MSQVMRDRAARTILLVSNDDDLRPMIRAYLEHLGFEVISCTDVRRAQEIASGSYAVNLLLLDVSSLGAGSLQTALALTGFPRAVPAVIIGGASLTADEINLVENQEWKVLTGPLRLPELLAVIQRAFDRRPLQPVSCPAPDISSSRRVLPFPTRHENQAACRAAASASNKLILTLPKTEGDVPRP